MKHTFGYIESGVNIHLPSAESCYPSLTALTYHRDNVLLK
jgi:hypothetical protein